MELQLEADGHHVRAVGTPAEFFAACQDHLPDLVPEINRVVLMKAGRVVADGSVADMLEERRLSDLFGRPLRLAERDGAYSLW